MQLSFLVGKLYNSSLLLVVLGFAFYIGLPAVISFVYVEQLVRRREKALPVALAFLLTGPLGMLFYNLYPAVGPIHTFRTWPAPPFNMEKDPGICTRSGGHACMVVAVAIRCAVFHLFIGSAMGVLYCDRGAYDSCVEPARTG